MRLIHLCFQLHLPRETREAEIEKQFREANERVYQPFFALMERNTQKYADWHFSLLVSGVWLEAAEKYDKELIERLKKLLKTGRIELINEPFYHSLAFFYNKDEFAAQVELYQEKVKDLFNFEGRIFALPDFMYNNAIGAWAEKFGFAGMLVGGGEKILDFRSVNHVYEAVGCEYLRLLFQNRRLVRKIECADEKLLTETERDGEKKKVLSAKKFQKMVDLACLRGNLVNLYFDAEVLGRQRERGVIGFFDLLIENWLAVKGNKFVNAKEACFAETPSMEVMIGETVDSKSEEVSKGSENESDAGAVVLLKDIGYKLPERLNGKAQAEFGKRLYALGREVAASEDDKLLAKFREWTVKDLQEKVQEEDLAVWEKEFAELSKQADEAKKKQAVEISRVYTKKRDRGLDDESIVKVNFGPAKEKIAVVDEDVSSDEDVESAESAERRVKVADVSTQDMIEVKRVVPTKIVVDEPEIVLPENDRARKPKRIKKIIKKFVIE